MNTNNYEIISNKYAKSEFKGTGYLAYRDIPVIIFKHSGNKLPHNLLDYGCGAGRSSRLAKDIGISEVIGVDKSIDMLNHARADKTDIKYQLIQNNILPFADNYFDYALSSFVILEISTIKEMLNIFNEIFKVLKPNGAFSILTTSEYHYTGNWLTNFTKYSKDTIFKDGQLVQVYIENIDEELNDYYWHHETYTNTMAEAGFKDIETYFPMGKDSDPFEWKDENDKPPFVIFTGIK